MEYNSAIVSPPPGFRDYQRTPPQNEVDGADEAGHTYGISDEGCLMNADFSFTEEDLDAGMDDDLEGDAPGGPQSVIAADVEMEGNLVVRYGVNMAGKFRGQLNSNSSITVNDTGHAEGDLDAHHVKIEGRVDGILTARKKLEILGGGTFVGELSTQPEVIVLSEFSKFGQNEDIAEEFHKEYVRKPKEKK